MKTSRRLKSAPLFSEEGAIMTRVSMIVLLLFCASLPVGAQEAPIRLKVVGDVEAKRR